MPNEAIEIPTIKHIKITNFWGRYSLDWELNPDINILIGSNGSGKTTLINMIEERFLGENNIIRKTNARMDIAFQNTYKSFDNNEENSYKTSHRQAHSPNFYKINTFDVGIKNKQRVSKENSPLFIQLSELIYGKGEAFSFIKLENIYALKELELMRENRHQEAAIYRNKVPNFFLLINAFFEKTGKKIAKDGQTQNIYFDLHEERLDLKDLSAGEKQLLIILFSVFLQQEKPFILLMDEPEISLHIGWQQKLIHTLRELNPNCQLIIASHSPSIWGNGWGDKLFFLDEMWQTTNDR